MSRFPRWTCTQGKCRAFRRPGRPNDGLDDVGELLCRPGRRPWGRGSRRWPGETEQAVRHPAGRWAGDLDKDRLRHRAAENGHGVGDVHDKTAIVVDDIISTTGTLGAAAEAVVGSGARRIFAVATHAVFAGQIYENLRSSPLERIVVTDAISLRPDVPALIDVVSCASLLADSIGRIFTDDSFSTVFRGKNHSV
ncbi:hypothetical protein [Pseudonocardia oceani]|uniref:hypothetical protein n=1 Tax=Pseudonocardia oceani TaxID=2792013 RepID=UPI001CEC5607|nr:hypothetical protein [Pseudonocardia oceani]